jgi:hypothetical protein
MSIYKSVNKETLQTRAALVTKTAHQNHRDFRQHVPYSGKHYFLHHGPTPRTHTTDPHHGGRHRFSEVSIGSAGCRCWGSGEEEEDRKIELKSGPKAYWLRARFRIDKRAGNNSSHDRCRIYGQ